MSGPVIETPRGKVIAVKGGSARLVWNASFRPRWQHRFTRSQMFVDSEVLRETEPYTPLLTSMLIKSGILGTHIGSGLIQWIAPYARAQYYSPRKPGSQTGPLRGPAWFERWKLVGGKRLVAKARALAGRG